MTLAPPGRVLVASDLHLAEGWDLETATCSRQENFLADGAFARWLAHHHADAGQGALLVLNGDSFDFVRIVCTPTSDAERAAWAARLPAHLKPRVNDPVSTHERAFGFQTDAFKSVWKLHVMITGHPEVFDALAVWIGAGGSVTVVKGNHDLELFWPEVIAALTKDLEDRIGRQGAGDPGAARTKLKVVQDSLTLGNLYLEHGHQYEAMTAVTEPPTRQSGTQLNYPLGSFINRYLINRLERLDPFLDNVKPVTQALGAVLRRRPLAVWRSYWDAWRFVWRALFVRKRWSAWGPVLAILAGLVLPPVALTFIALRLFWPEAVAWVPSWVRVPGTIAGLSFPMILPYLLGLLRELQREVGLIRPENHLLKGAEGVLKRGIDGFRRVYAVMGHTHEQGVWRVEVPDRAAFYVNTGTWIALWPLDRPDLAGRVFYSFARFTWAGAEGYTHEALVWDDQAGESRPALLLAEETV